jgi:hypothetical protein
MPKEIGVITISIVQITIIKNWDIRQCIGHLSILLRSINDKKYSALSHIVKNIKLEGTT